MRVQEPEQDREPGQASARARCPYPFPRPGPLDPPEELAGLRAEPLVPVTLPSGDEAVLVTRYADVRRLLTDDRLSRNIDRPGAARISRNNRMFQDPRINPDPPEHTRVRRLVMRAFTPARVEAMRPFVERVVDELLDEMERRGGPVDLNETLAFPLPIRVMCELLGVPDADMERFRSWTDHFLSVSRYTGPQIGAAMRELNAYIAELIEAKRREPGEDLVSAMTRVRDEEDGQLAEYELQWWCRLLLLVGYETTATQLGGGVALLLAHPEQLAALKADRSLLPGAIEEMLRWKLVGSSVSMLRYAVADIPMDGYTIPQGTSVIPAVDSANQDETVFPRPEVFDITRDASKQLSFSAGPHFCIGANLARLELEVATERLFRRFPGLRLTVAPDELRRQEGALLEGFVELPVTW
ncbi:cytochrome P450 [Streptomyces sp. MST-110588]|uniref:cytochrome P450 n=1 Tax=Streptomyces sp. MST-110588 TaxID=2833628 RepID=UPI001F5D97E5|nr:cytochrome P450 [Streptomyces sp. MST-110588]UNO40754.1 cytochrome P450 [Streptomyces sp. MST-110588]